MGHKDRNRLNDDMKKVVDIGTEDKDHAIATFRTDSVFLGIRLTKPELPEPDQRNPESPEPQDAGCSSPPSVKYHEIGT